MATLGAGWVQEGLSECLIDGHFRDHVIVSTRHPSIDYVPAGNDVRPAATKRTPMSAPIGALAQAASTFMSFRYDFVLIDTPSEPRKHGLSISLRMSHLLLVLTDQPKDGVPAVIRDAIAAIHPVRHSNLKHVQMIESPGRKALHNDTLELMVTAMEEAVVAFRV